MLKPIKDRIIVKPITDQFSQGGIIMVTDNNVLRRGEVLAHGPGRRAIRGSKTIPIGVKVGDIVFYNENIGQAVKNAGGDLLVMTSDDILAVVEPDSRE